MAINLEANQLPVSRLQDLDFAVLLHSVDTRMLQEWEQMTGESWPFIPGYQLDENNRRIDPIHQLSPDLPLSRLVLEKAAVFSNQIGRECGGMHQAENSSSLKTNETPGQLYHDLEARAPHYGRDLLGMFRIDNGWVYASPTELQALAREVYPNPADWVGQARTDMAMHQAFPTDLQDKMSRNKSTIQRAASMTEDITSERAAAFNRFYGDDYAFLGKGEENEWSQGIGW